MDGKLCIKCSRLFLLNYRDFRKKDKTFNIFNYNFKSIKSSKKSFKNYAIYDERLNKYSMEISMFYDYFLSCDKNKNLILFKTDMP
jgi:hypothetical protein